MEAGEGLFPLFSGFNSLSRGAGEKEDAADLVSSLSSYEETVTLPWNCDTSSTGSGDTKLFWETLSTIGIFKQALQITIDPIGTLKRWYSDLVG